MKRRQRAFTLIELLVTLAILGLLASLLVPVAETVRQRGREQDLREGLRAIRHAIDDYKLAYDQGRIAHALATTGYPPNLDVLVNGVPDQRSPTRARMFFLRRLPRDPFEPDLTLSPAQSWGRRSYASEAAHPQVGMDVYDVYSRSEQIGLNGLAYRDW